MSVNPMASAKTADFRNAHAALLRAAQAAQAAQAKFKQFNIPIVVPQNGQIVKLAVN